MCECLGSACLSAAVCLFVCLCSDQSPISLIVSADVFSVSLRACTCMCRGLRGCLDYMSSNFSKSVCLGLHVLFSLPLCPCPIVCLDLSVLFCLSSSISTSLSALVSFVLELYVGLDICVRLSVSPCMSVCLLPRQSCRHFCLPAITTAPINLHSYTSSCMPVWIASSAS